MKAIYKLVFLLLASVYGIAHAQSNNILYLSSGATGKIYDISSLTGGDLISATPVATYSPRASLGNLAVGPNPSGGGYVFTHSDTFSGSAVFVNGVDTAGDLPGDVGGLTANPSGGYTYGISSGRRLLRANPTPLDLGAITGDAVWNGSTPGNDSFFDPQGNMYVVTIRTINSTTTSYIYKIDITTRTAALYLQLNGALPTNFQGLAYFNNKIYAAQAFQTTVSGQNYSNVRIYEIDPGSGAGTVKANYVLMQGTVDAGNNLDLATGVTFVAPTSDLSVTKTVNPNNPKYGSNVTFTITATNNGPNNNTNVSVSDVIPSGYTTVNYTPSTGTYNATTGVWAIGTLNNGASATLSIVAKVLSAGSYTNTATIIGSLSDPDTSNNSASATPAPIQNTIDAVNDSYNLVTGSSNVESVLSNDTYNSGAATTSNVTVSQVSTTNAGVTINSSGIISVGNSVPAGTYTLVYQMCDKSDPSHCDTATVIVTVVTTPLVCNTPTNLITSATYPNLSVTTTNTFGTGWSGNVNVIDSDLSNFANNCTLCGIGPKSLRVTDPDHTFTVGTYAGFHIGTATSPLPFEIRLYNNGSLVQTGIFSTLVTTGSDFVLKSTVAFDAVEIYLTAGGINVYYPILTRTCPTVLECNTMTAWKNNAFSDLTVTSSATGNTFFRENLIDTDDTNAATATAGLPKSFRVSDDTNIYGAGTFVGYNLSLITLPFDNTFTINTYKKNSLGLSVLAESKTFTAGSSFPSGARVDVGFVATEDFDSVEIIFAGSLTASIYYPILMRSCSSPDLVCNTEANVSQSSYSVTVNPERTGAGGLNVGASWAPNFGAVVSPSTTDYSSLSASGIVASAYLSVKDISTVYPAGTFAGFKIQNISIFDASLLSGITIRTYNGGVLQESQSGSSIFASVSAFDITNPQVIGFETTKTFDEVQITVDNPFGLSLGETRVFNLVLKKPCEGTVPLVCNTPTNYTTPNYPVNISLPRTGLTGALAAGNYVQNSENVIDADANNFANITLLTGVGNSGSISVKKSLSTFPAGYFAGFTIRNASIVNSNFLGGVTISTYLDGVEQENVSGTSVIFGVGSTIFNGGTKQTLGIVTKFDFDEVRISVNNIVGFDLGTTEVYNLVITKTCQGVIDCNNEYYLVNPTFPVVLDIAYTGTSGLSCTNSSVENPGYVIDNDPSNFAVFNLSGTVCTNSIGVVDPSNTYPKGTFAGYTVKYAASLGQLSFFNNTTIKTYLDGVLQESKTSSQLSSFSLFYIPIWGIGTQNVGFTTTKPFDEVVMEISGVFGSTTVEVYGLFINTKTSDGGSLSCASGVCYKPGATGGTVLETKHGITALSRAGSSDSDNWPMVRNGAWTVLESKEKGFVINRVALTANLSSITNPIEGMMVYDEEADCLKIYTIKDGDTTAAWHCLTTQACPD
ncbi:MAG: hypothetical protein K0R77_3238 [Chryseobacterium sp.]|jgi:uncharacterized repeat protein (TIGR01451 family)|uniref:DUF11 domain-containing protein n=1 Tax=Chryseobacterium sp. TaxID=1871047 RepID=UPI0026136116|nr:DUF11 domain-containing protein [Chryseobacterium sp.]MDF2553963.1 hypothetical protein [Chryseobacterium sp.]